MSSEKIINNPFDPSLSYRQRLMYQTIRWVAGESLHNPVENECCPDFSCCHPDLKAPRKVREKFANADRETRETMLGFFIAALARKAGVK